MKVEIVGFGDKAHEHFIGEIVQTTNGVVYVKVPGKKAAPFRKVDGYKVGDRHRASGYRLITAGAKERPAGEKALVFMVGIFVQGDDSAKTVFVGDTPRFTILKKNGLWWLPVEERPTGAPCSAGHATVLGLLKAWVEHIGLS